MKRSSLVIGLIICAQLLSACSDKGASKLNPAGTPAPKADVQDAGTGDGGGGNAINFKMLESHIIDPMTLPVVKNRVAAMFAKIYPDMGDKIGNIFKAKTWYMAPISLKTLPKEVLGVEFTKDRLQQVAIHTDREIWIDSNIFDKMSEEEQATLIVHEVNMASYLNRFKNFDEICKTFDRMGLGKCELRYADVLNEMYKPEPSRRLNDKDYNILRTMTAWFFQNEATLNRDSFEEAQRRIEFADPRLVQLGTATDSSAASEVKITVEQLLITLKEAQVSKSLTSGCEFLKLKKNIPCTIEVRSEKKVQVVTDQYSIPYEEISISFKNKNDGELLQSVHIPIYMNPTLALSYAIKVGTYYSFSGATLDLFQKEGTTGHNVHFSFTADSSQNIKLVSLVVIPMVNAGKYQLPDKKASDGAVMKCERQVVSTIEPEVIAEDILAMASSVDQLQIAKMYQYLSTMGHGSSCSSIK